MANYGFRYFDANIAEAITMMGQVSIKHTNGYVNEFLNKILKTNKDYCITIDTDSVVGDSIINVDGKDITIEEYYNKCVEFIKCDEFNNQYVKSSNGEITLAVDKFGNIVNKKIVHVMKHKVKKHMYKVSIDSKSVTITEDHSLMVDRNGEIISTTVKKIKKGDKILHLIDK